MERIISRWNHTGGDRKIHSDGRAVYTSVHVTCGIYEESVKSGTESSMFHEHGLNIGPASIIKKYTSLPVGAVGGINSPEQVDQAIADGKIDFAIFGRQMLADPDFAQKCMNGDEAQIRRCLRCYKCFPGSPEEGYDDLPFTSEQLAVYVGHCTINPMAHLPFDIEQLPAAEKGSQKVLIVGGGIAGIQAAITAAERGHKVTLAEKSDKTWRIAVFYRCGYRQTGSSQFQRYDDPRSKTS